MLTTSKHTRRLTISEKASIDEAFFDFTRPVRRIMLERFPYLAKVPPDAPHGIDTLLPPPPPILWGYLGHVIPINPAPQSSISASNDKKSEETEKVQADDATNPEERAESPDAYPNQMDSDMPVEAHEEEDGITTWHDVALSIAAELMQKARQEVLEKLGYSTSAVGVSIGETAQEVDQSMFRRELPAISF